MFFFLFLLPFLKVATGGEWFFYKMINLSNKFYNVFYFLMNVQGIAIYKIHNFRSNKLEDIQSLKYFLNISFLLDIC